MALLALGRGLLLRLLPLLPPPPSLAELTERKEEVGRLAPGPGDSLRDENPLPPAAASAAAVATAALRRLLGCWLREGGASCCRSLSCWLARVAKVHQTAERWVWRNLQRQRARPD